MKSLFCGRESDAAQTVTIRALDHGHLERRITISVMGRVSALFRPYLKAGAQQKSWPNCPAVIDSRVDFIWAVIHRVVLIDGLVFKSARGRL